MGVQALSQGLNFVQHAAKLGVAALLETLGVEKCLKTGR
jgi:hypothetical protein